MGSHDIGKDVVVRWIRDNFPPESTVLDVGACDGKWRWLLSEYKNMDAVEIFKPSYDGIRSHYRNAYNIDMADFEYEWYDLIIFGDVIEHMEVETAQKVLRYAAERCKDMVVAVPYLYEQGEMYGNKWERHIQPDLTAEVFAERYPDLEILHDTNQNYCFYHRRLNNA